jgi:large subunit ribosomal protein L15
MTTSTNLTSGSKFKSRKRVGRGSSAGGGTTAGRGTKGQKARTGGQIPWYFEGGQTPLIRRVAKKKGFRSRNQTDVVVFNLDALAKLARDSKINLSDLVARGLVGKSSRVKILARGEIASALSVQTHSISSAARKAIEDAGGSVELLS